MFENKVALTVGALCITALLATTLFFWRPEGSKSAYLSAPMANEEVPEEFRNEPIQPVPSKVNVNPAIAALGKKLFHDPRLSANNLISCASCHNISTAGVDGKRYSVGINGIVGKLNAPTVFNSGLNPFQFWDGRATTLEDQINGPLTNKHEMGTNWPEVIRKLKSDPEYRHDFSTAFQNGVTGNNISHAIAEYERTLVTPNSRFDRFLKGDTDAISPQEKHGYRLFKRYGCASCHQGAAAGGNMFERLGSVRRYFDDHPMQGPEDLGRYNITHDENHRHYFKVPSLRNVEKTAPYFHNGSAATLEEAVKIMSFYNLGIKMPDDDVALITQFLKTLTGEFEGRPL